MEKFGPSDRYFDPPEDTFVCHLCEYSSKSDTEIECCRSCDDAFCRDCIDEHFEGGVTCATCNNRSCCDVLISIHETKSKDSAFGQCRFCERIFCPACSTRHSKFHDGECKVLDEIVESPADIFLLIVALSKARYGTLPRDVEREFELMTQRGQRAVEAKRKGGEMKRNTCDYCGEMTTNWSQPMAPEWTDVVCSECSKTDYCRHCDSEFPKWKLHNDRTCEPCLYRSK